MTTRIQHYVWRHYLEAWFTQGKKVWAARGSKVLGLVNPKNLMAERDFYQVPQLSDDEVDALRAYAESFSPRSLWDLHFQLIRICQYIGQRIALIESMAFVPEEEKKRVNSIMIEAEELLHSGIEQRAVSILCDLRNRNLNWLGEEDVEMAFFQFIAQQYFRTKLMRSRKSEILGEMLPAKANRWQA